MLVTPAVNPNLIGNFLENVLKARPQQTTNYRTVAQAFGLPDFTGEWDSHPLSQIFEVLDQQDALAGRPFRTSAVIAVIKNAPGPGFYSAMQRLKGVPDPVTTAARERLWLSELRAAHAYSWP